jgi:hypothetical protein
MSESRTYPRQSERINGSLLRLRVPGGWVVYSSASACFVPDAEERWVLEPEQAVKPTHIPQPPMR